MNLEAGGSPKPVLNLSRQVVQGRVVLVEPVYRCLQVVEPVVLVESGRRDDLIIRVMVIMVMTMAIIMMVVTETFWKKDWVPQGGQGGEGRPYDQAR